MNTDTTGLRLELFVDDVAASTRFYTEVLGFSVMQNKDDGYVALRRGDALISLNRRQVLSPDAPHYRAAAVAPGLGTEIVIEVSDVDAQYRQILDAGWPIAEGLQDRPWGLGDFRVVDPDGFYLRITSRRG